MQRRRSHRVDDLLVLRFHTNRRHCDELPSSRQDVDACLLGIRTRNGIVHDRDGLVSQLSDFCNDRRVAVNDVCRTKGFEFVSMFEGGGGDDGRKPRVFGKLND